MTAGSGILHEERLPAAEHCLRAALAESSRKGQNGPPAYAASKLRNSGSSV